MGRRRRNNAKYAFQYTITTTIGKKEEEEKKEQKLRTLTTIFAVGYPSSS